LRAKAAWLVLAAGALGLGPGRAGAEPMFISRQYTRCTTCHYSPTGGGLLTPYGRSLSRQELSTTGASAEGTQRQSTTKEEAFLWGILGSSLHPVDVGIDIRPARLNLDFGGVSMSQNMFMTADLLAAYRVRGWTVYGEVGREPTLKGSAQSPKIGSYEYWVGHQAENGFGFRVGRFLPAYGIRLADHTAYTRTNLGFNVYDQVYGLELSRSSEHRLLELSLGPGYADSILHDDGRRAFTATGRFQMDLGSRSALVVSGLFRDKAKLESRNGAGGLAFGFSPTSRLSVWTEADAQFRQGAPGAPAYVLLNETGFEVHRGLWLKFSPQIRTDFGQTSGGSVRMAFEADLLPRTHWNVDVSYYRDKSRATNLVSKTFLAQLHLYL
jgi:hypothetical protein